jgi:hypothetical protein
VQLKIRFRCQVTLADEMPVAEVGPGNGIQEGVGGAKKPPAQLVLKGRLALKLDLGLGA